MRHEAGMSCPAWVVSRAKQIFVLFTYSYGCIGVYVCLRVGICVCLNSFSSCFTYFSYLRVFCCFEFFFQFHFAIYFILLFFTLILFFVLFLFCFCLFFLFNSYRILYLSLWAVVKSFWACKLYAHVFHFLSVRCLSSKAEKCAWLFSFGFCF